MHSAYGELNSLLDRLEEVERAMEALKDQQTHIRMDIEDLVTAANGNLKIDGRATCYIAPPAQRVSWDTKMLEELIDNCYKHNRPKIAEAIESCRKLTTISGGLRISKRGHQQ